MKHIYSIITVCAITLISCSNPEQKQNDDIEESEKYHLIGYQHYENGEYKDAIENYNKSIELFPKHEVALLNRGNAKDEIGDIEGAIEDYSKAIEIRPDMGMAYFNRALIKETKLQDSIGALADYEMTIKVEPSYNGIFFNYGFLLHNLKRHDEAIKSFESHIESYGTDDFAYYYIATSYYAINDSTKGNDWLDKSAELGNNMAIELKEKLVTAKPKLH